MINQSQIRHILQNLKPFMTDGVALGEVNLPACYVQDMAEASLAGLMLLEKVAAISSHKPIDATALDAAIAVFTASTHSVFELRIEKNFKDGSTEYSFNKPIKQ